MVFNRTAHGAENCMKYPAMLSVQNWLCAGVAPSDLAARKTFALEFLARMEVDND